MMDAAIFTSTNGMKEAEEAISAIAGLPAGTFLDASEAMKADFMECAVGGKVAKDVAVNILLKHQYAPITKLIDALKGIVMQHAEAPHSQLSARFTSSLRTGIDSFEQWLVGGGMKGCMMAACDLFDANGDGMISIDELEQMFTKPQSMSEMLTLLFSIGDADGDGELTKDEVMGLVHRYVNLLVAVMELTIDVYVETALAVAKPLLTAILEAYESPLGFTMETVRVLVNEGPEAGAGRLQILATHCQITAMNAMQSGAMLFFLIMFKNGVPGSGTPRIRLGLKSPLTPREQGRRGPSFARRGAGRSALPKPPPGFSLVGFSLRAPGV
eukprot:FR742303.1.p1 GENE.FR742303.1~~FR742303.1.p1  ORF type:complete len:364 (+),score=63.78 FR742303.1:111-1094(+)